MMKDIPIDETGGYSGFSRKTGRCFAGF